MCFPASCRRQMKKRIAPITRTTTMQPQAIPAMTPMPTPPLLDPLEVGAVSVVPPLEPDPAIKLEPLPWMLPLVLVAFVVGAAVVVAVDDVDPLVEGVVVGDGDW